MKIFYTDTFPIPLPENHSFPKDKYFLLRMRILEHPGDHAVDLRVPESASDEDILRVHDPEYVRRLLSGELTDKEIRRVGLPWSPEIVRRDSLLLRHCREAGLAVAVTMAGGYAHNVQDAVDIHFQTILSALQSK